MLSDLVWLLKERAVSHLLVFFWLSSKPGAKLKPLVMVITLNENIFFWHNTAQGNVFKKGFYCQTVEIGQQSISVSQSGSSVVGWFKPK